MTTSIEPISCFDSAFYCDADKAASNICPICCKVLNQPMLTPCGHVFCQDCIKTWLKSRCSNDSNDSEDENPKTCPECRTKTCFHHCLLDLRTARSIAQLEFKCPQGNCQWKGAIGINGWHAKKHLEQECEFTLVPCKWKCESAVWRSNLTEHESTCDHQMDICQYCLREEKRKDMQIHHQESCEKIEISCPNGCTERYLRGSQTEHEETCANQPILCPNSVLGCEEVHNRCVMDKHANQTCVFRGSDCEFCHQRVLKVGEHQATDCELFPIVCPNQCSFEPRFPRSQLSKHIQEDCPLQPILCDVPECGDMFPRNQAESHEQTAVVKHVRILKRKFIQQEELQKTNQHREKEAKLEEEHFFRQRLDKGFRLDVKDTMGTWYPARIIETREDQVLVAYAGWSSQWNEWIDRDSNRLASLASRCQR